MFYNIEYKVIILENKQKNSNYTPCLFELEKHGVWKNYESESSVEDIKTNNHLLGMILKSENTKLRQKNRKIVGLEITKVVPMSKGVANLQL